MVPSAFRAVLLSLMVITLQTRVRAEEDPHRPVCKDAHCQKIQTFLKAHYCGKSPFGNGPDEGCEIISPKASETGMRTIAHFSCQWSESERKTVCQQNGQPPSDIRMIVMRELHRLGLPAGEDKQTYFNVWKSSSSGWSLAEGYHLGPVDKDINITLCQVIVLVDKNSQGIVLRKLPFEKTNADVPKGTTWGLLDLADVDGDGRPDVILQGDDYENHWIEVDAIDNGLARTIYSGLGYYL